MALNPWPVSPKGNSSYAMREFKGINKLDPFSIQGEYAEEMKNLTSDRYPAFTTRPGFTLLGSAMPQKVLGLGAWKNNELHAISNANWYRYSGGAWSSLTSGLNASAEWSFANFDGSFADIYLIGANGVDSMKVYNSTSIIDLVGSPAGGNYVINYMNRVFCAVGNLLRASALNIATDWTTAAGNDTDPFSISVDTIDGETINALKPGIGHVTIFKPNSIHELLGSDPSNVRVEAISFEVGSINNKSVVNLNGTLFIIHRTGIYRYGGGSQPSRDFSRPVQWYIDNMNVTARNLCAAGTDGQKLYFSIPISSSTAPDTLLVYDPKFDTWTVWKDFNALQLIQTSSGFYMGLNDGRVVQQGGTTDNGTAIAWERVSKPFTADQMSRKIRWMRIWVVCDVPAGSALNVFVSPSPTGDGDWISAGSIAPKTGVQSARIIFKPSVLAQSNYLRIKFSGTGPVTIHEWDREEIDYPII